LLALVYALVPRAGQPLLRVAGHVLDELSSPEARRGPGGVGRRPAGVTGGGCSRPAREPGVCRDEYSTRRPAAHAIGLPPGEALEMAGGLLLGLELPVAAGIP